MIYNDTHLFIQMPKCASSSVHTYLINECRWNRVDTQPFVSWQHRPWCMASKELRALQPFSTIRNPWDWYRSVYAYGMRTKWIRNFPAAREGFPPWLAAVLGGGVPGEMHSPQKIQIETWAILRKYDIGLLTLYYLLQCGFAPAAFMARRLQPEQVGMGVTRFARVEHLAEDLSDILGDEGAWFADWPRHNVSGSEEYPYTPELAALVAHKERLIVERFGYKFQE